MRGNNVMGLLFSNMHEESIRELTDRRTMASVPIGGRYRMIDFTLSSMVNSGINRVGVITKRNYQSLMDHLGTGKAWDLSYIELRATKCGYPLYKQLDFIEDKSIYMSMKLSFTEE